MGEETLRFRRQVIAHRAALARTATARMGGDQPVVLVNGHGGIACAQPQGLTDQSERHRIQATIMGDMAVAMHCDAMPAAEIGRDGGQGLQQWLLDGEQIQRQAPGGAVDAAARSSTQVRACPLRSARSRKLRKGMKLPFTYLTPASTMPFFCGSAGGQGSMRKP